MFQSCVGDFETCTSSEIDICFRSQIIPLCVLSCVPLDSVIARENVMLCEKLFEVYVRESQNIEILAS